MAWKIKFYKTSMPIVAFWVLEVTGVILAIVGKNSHGLYYTSALMLFCSLIALAFCVPSLLQNGRRSYWILLFHGFTAIIVMIFSYAILYSTIGLKTSCGDITFSFVDGIYFSVTTFTTLGYGDITVENSDLKLLTSIQAINGALYFPITTAFWWFMMTEYSKPKKTTKED